MPDRPTALHPLYHQSRGFEIQWRCQVGGRAARRARARQCRALDATAKCQCCLPLPALWPLFRAFLWQATTGQCILHEIGRIGRANSFQHCVTSLLLFRLLRHHSTAAARGSHGWPTVSRCKAMDGEGRSHCPCCHASSACPAAPAHLSLQIWKHCDPSYCSQQAPQSQQADKLRSSTLLSSRQLQGAHALVLNPRSSFNTCSPLLGSHVFWSNMRRAPLPAATARRRNAGALCTRQQPTSCSVTVDQLNWPHQLANSPTEAPPRLALAAEAGPRSASIRPGQLNLLWCQFVSHTFHPVVMAQNSTTGQLQKQFQRY